MTVTINHNYFSMFSSNLFDLLEQRSSKLKGLFMEEASRGEKHFFDRLGGFTAAEVVNRLEDVTLQDAAHSRRMATVKRYAASTYMDSIDKMKMLIDPTSDYAMKLAAAHGRNFDQTIIAAILGTAATGADGASTQAFDTSNQQIAHGSAGLTAAKFHQALRILESNEVDMDGDLYLLLNARGLEDLMAETTFISADFQNMKPLAGKMVPEFRGVKLIRTERLPDATAGSVYRAILCTPSTLKVAMNKEVEVKVAERPDLNFAQQISTYMHFGAVRMEEASVVDILFQ
jgi:hypothetical protein